MSFFTIRGRKLTDALRDVYEMPPSWLRPKRSTDYLANTVDSFQGNQADLVIVSLVRDNSRPTPRKALGQVRELRGTSTSNLDRCRPFVALPHVKSARVRPGKFY